MGDTNCVPCVPLVPPVAPSATNSNTKCTGRRIIQSSMDDSKFSTQVNYSYLKKHSGDRGQLLGIIRPAWRKVQESECRLNWLDKMVRRKLVVRDIESFARIQGEMLRSEELKVQEKERDILFGLMLLKLKDEKRNLIALRGEMA